jgi:hypothetical protein
LIDFPFLYPLNNMARPVLTLRELSLLDEALADMEELDARQPEPLSVPARPKLTAKSAEAYVRKVEELEIDDAHMATLWSCFDSAERAVSNIVDKIKLLAWTPQVEISAAELQALLIKHAELEDAARLARNHVQRFTETLGINCKLFANMTVEVLAHRPPQHALLDPAEGTRVPVDTPTSGPVVTDEDALLRDYGVDINT